MGTRVDVYQEITASVVAALRAGAPPWRQPWTGGAGGLPLRSTGEPYKGINAVSLWCASVAMGFTHSQWFTYRQAVAFGGQVRKGEKGSRVVKYGTVDREADYAAEGQGADKKVIPFLKSYTVFNADQIEWETTDFLEGGKPPRDLGTESDPELDAVFEAMGISTEFHEKPVAYYSPQADRVFMPHVSTFHEAAEFYATQAHEYAHATGHRKRLDRFPSARAQSTPEYAREELVAELGGALVCASLGINASVEQSAAYLDHWIEALTGDHRLIFRVAASAQRAADLLLDAAESGAGGNAAPVMVAAE